MASYLFAAMLFWLPVSAHPEPFDISIARYESIAADVADVVSREDEPAIFENDPDKTKTALLVLVIAYFESSYSARIERQECHADECDGGAAVGLWQMHVGGGINFDGLKWKQDPNGYHKADLLADRKLYIRLVLHVLRGWHSAGWDGPSRRRKATDYLRANPR